MAQDELHMHYVCTHTEAENLIKTNDRFWVSNCGCREGKGNCARSRIDVCMIFKGDAGASGSGLKEITLAGAGAIMIEAKTKNLVTRPFRNMKNKSETEGICFCCDDCCGYFLNEDEVCDKGRFIESTDKDNCTLCGDCLEVCHFKARDITDSEMLVNRDNCYGCGLCAKVCPEKCVEMVARG
jgi:Pyruvate/2-oxoacid:ferredoxin oxidoreductase delta subunit